MTKVTVVVKIIDMEAAKVTTANVKVVFMVEVDLLVCCDNSIQFSKENIICS